MNYFMKAFGYSGGNQTENDNGGEQANTRKEDIESNGSKSIVSGLLTSLSLGMDVLKSGISLPVKLHEPMTILQRTVEMVSEANVLEKAGNLKDSHSRLAYVVAYAVSGFAGSERLYTDFNPLLGETFEWIDPQTGFKVITEQVSHHPPISALHAESDVFSIHQNAHIETKFLGNSIDLHPQGKTHIVYKRTGDHFFYKSPSVRIHNLILGSMWIEHYGDMKIENLINGDSCVLNFKKCGMFEGVRYDIEGYIIDKNGQKIIRLQGLWNKILKATWLKDTDSHPAGYEIVLWEVKDEFFLGGKYNFNQFAMKLLECDSNHPEDLIAPTDSRLRIDRRALALKAYDKATKFKRYLEVKQRQDKKEREKNQEVWTPCYFKKMAFVGNDEMYVYCGQYWERRDEKKRLLEMGLEVDDDPLCDSSIRGKACDFRAASVQVNLQ